MQALMKTTKSVRPADVEKKWHLIDAEGLVVGRVASIIANILRGKHKPSYTPHVDCGDHVVVVNAEKVRFTGRNYVLPRTGQAGVPLVSVNAPKIDVEVLRVGERGLLPSLRSEEFLGQLNGVTARTIADQKGRQIWKGSLDTAKGELNQEVVTAFPVLQAVGKLEPGLYIMLAKASGTSSASDDEGGYEQQATQWFVVSDLGLTAFKGRDGVHVLTRSLASATAIASADIRLIAKNNDVLATAKTDAKGRMRG